MRSETSAQRLWALHAGGFMGPFGGAMTYTMLPELATAFGGSVHQAASAAVTAYMIPFAALMLVSGTVAARWGLAVTVRRAFALYCAASLLCVFATDLNLFLVGRALQGVANAFTTPLLIAMISAAVPAERLGRSLGTYASMQAAGQGFAPLIGGTAAAIDYRLAFVATAVVAILLVVSVPAGGERKAEASPGRWRALLGPRVLRVGGIAFCSQLVGTAVITIGALIASDRFDLSPSVRGLVVAAYGAAGLMIAPAIGRLADSVGLSKVGVRALLVAAIGIALIGIMPWLPGLILLIGIGGAAATGGRILTNSLAVTSTPSNPAGATSVMLSLQFLGAAAMPLLLPVYDRSVAIACLAAATVGLGGLGLLLYRNDSGRPSDRPEPSSFSVS